VVMAKSKKKWVSLTQEKLEAESSKSSCKYIGDKVVHCAEPIPDNDWVGETWGLYFSDYEEELLRIIEHDTDKYMTVEQEETVVNIMKKVMIELCLAEESTLDNTEEHTVVEFTGSLDSIQYLKKSDAGPLLFLATSLPPLSRMVDNTPPLHPPLYPQNVESVIEESPGSIQCLEYDLYYPNKSEHTSEQLNSIILTTIQSLLCPPDWDLHVHDPVHPVHQPGSGIGTLGVVLRLEYREENSSDFCKIHKDWISHLARVSIREEKLFMCRTETPPPPSTELPTRKLPDNAQHPQLHKGDYSPAEEKGQEKSKWSWMKTGDGAANRAKQGLALFW